MRRRDHEQVRILKGEVYDLIVKEDCLWHQRSRVDWLKSRDMNTTYFHSRATQRNRRNYISNLERDNGSVIEEEHLIGEKLVNYFTKLFTLA